MMLLRVQAPAWANGWLGKRLLVALGLALTTLAASAMDDPPGRVGRVGETKGQVWMIEGGQGEWFDLQRNRPLTTGDRIATDRDAHAELQVGSTTLRLAERSEVQLLRLDDDRIELMISSGSASVRVRQPEVAGEVDLQTAEGHFKPRMPGLYRVDATERGSFGAALSGELQFDGRDSSLAIRAGQRAEFWVDGADRATHYTWASLPADEFDQWVRRDDWRDERRADNRYVSPEMTGAQDLDRYGQWQTHAEYGALWAPAVEVGWAPYRYGRWAWVAPWGWTWVDDAPWGFAPFHYGRWVMFGGRWCWAPGRYVHRPVYAPAMVAWVGGANFSVSMQVGGGPAVGWIPLAPREAYYPAYRTSPVYVQNVNVTHIHLPPGPQSVRHPPTMYTNRGVPGGITVVPAQALSQRQPVAVAPQRASDEAVSRAWQGRGGPQFIAPPQPQGAPVGARVLPTPGNALSGPRPPVANLPGREQLGDPRRDAPRAESPAVSARPLPAAQPAPRGDGLPQRSPVESAQRQPVPQVQAAQPVVPVLPQPRPVTPAPRSPQVVPPAPAVQDVPRAQPGRPGWEASPVERPRAPERAQMPERAQVPVPVEPRSAGPAVMERPALPAQRPQVEAPQQERRRDTGRDNPRDGRPERRNE